MMGQMTMNKLISLILVGVVVVLLIWGTTAGWLNPLFKSVEGNINEVALALGRFAGNNKTDESCRTGFVPDGISEIEGEIKVCRDECTFLIYEPNEILTYEEFKLSSLGHSARILNEDDFINIDAFGSSLEMSNLHRDAYNELMNVLNDFYRVNSYGVSFEDFFEPLGYDTPAHLQIIVEEGRDMDQIYDFDGETWIRIYNKNPYEIEDDKVFPSIYSSYAYGNDVYWNYLDDGKRNVVMSDFNTNFQNEKYSKEEFISWLVKQRTEVENKPEKKFFYINIDTRFLNSLYHYACDDVSCDWGKRFLFWFNDIEESKVLDEVFKAHENKQKIIWYNANGGDTYTPITNQRISVRTDKEVEEKFEKWFNDMESEFREKKKTQNELFAALSNYLEDIRIEFEGESFDVFIGDVLDIDKSRILIYFDASENERFGVYFPERANYPNNEKKFILTFENLQEKRELEEKIYPEYTTSGQVYDAQYVAPEIEKFSIKSIVADFVNLNDNDWKDFLKINEINEYLVRQC